MSKSPCVAPRVVLLFDANMPLTIGCQDCCGSIHIISRPKTCSRCPDSRVLFSRATDLEIAEWGLSVIRDQYTDSQGVPLPKHYALVTKDVHFISSAIAWDRRRQKRGIFSPYHPIDFTVTSAGHGTISTGQEESRITLAVCIVPSSVSGRAYEVTTALEYARSVSATSRP